MAHDVFVSYSHHDKPQADAVCATLETNGIRCWIAPRDVIPGQEWGAAIVDAIRSARVMVLVFSSHANASPQIRREVERAVHAEAVLIPFRIEDVAPARSLEFFLGAPHWLDALTPPLEAHLERLAAAVMSFLVVGEPFGAGEVGPQPVKSSATEEPSKQADTAANGPTAASVSGPAPEGLRTEMQAADRTADAAAAANSVIPKQATAASGASSGEILRGYRAKQQSTNAVPISVTKSDQPVTIGRPPSAVHTIDKVAFTIGRAPENNVVLPDLLVSRRHALLQRSGSQWELRDLGSANSTYVNGVRVSRAIIGPDDIIGVGHHNLQLSGERLMEYVDTGDVPFAASDLTVMTEEGRVLLAGVSFVLPQRSFLAVVGPSGAGKSILLGALTGLHPASAGSVRYGDRDLYDNYAELRHRIAVVPQDDTLHNLLTVRRELNYAARLRFPRDVSATERDQRIEEVMAGLGLTAQADLRFDSLSEARRKRTSFALELLTKPSLLFLDEPTTGLDARNENSVMRTLRALSDYGHSVVVATHNVTHLNLCDQVLVLAPGGRAAYFGPPQDALTYFQCSDFAEIFQVLDRNIYADWTARFKLSPVHDASTGPHATECEPRQPAATAASRQAMAQHSRLAQFATLCRRQVELIGADRRYAALLVILPFLLSLSAHAVPGRVGLSEADALTQRSNEPSQLLTVLIVGGALMGCAASIREIVGERAIYLREYRIGLSPGAYVASKLVVLTAVTSLQGLILGLLGVLGRPGPGQAVLLHWGTIEVAAAVVAVTVVSMIAGLVISALITNAKNGIPLLVLTVLGQLILCGGLFAVHDRIVLEQLAWLSPSRWAYAMAASTVGLNDLRRQLGEVTDPLWDHAPGSWLTALGMCVALAIAMVIMLRVRLSRLDL